MCVDTPGMPPLRPAGVRGPADRIPPEELTDLGGGSAAWVVDAVEPGGTDGRAVGGQAVGGARPVLVLCHERYGVVRHTVDLAERFAARGFVTVAPDLYADAVLTGDEERLPDVPDEVVLRHLDAAIGHARTRPGAGPASPVVVVGVCRSGSYPLLADAGRADVAAAVLLYGGAQPREYAVGALRRRPYPEIVAGGRAPVLGLFGERDHTISVADVRRLRDLFEDAGRDYDITVHEDLPHGWLNDTMPGRFRAEAAEETFERITGWLHATLGRRGRATGTVDWVFRSRISTGYDFATNERQH